MLSLPTRNHKLVLPLPLKQQSELALNDKSAVNFQSKPGLTETIVPSDTRDKVLH